MQVALPFGIIIYLLRVFDNDDKYVIKEILGKSDYHEGNIACRRLWNPHLPNNKSCFKTAPGLIRQANDLLSDFSF